MTTESWNQQRFLTEQKLK